MDTQKHHIPDFITINKLGDAILVHVRESQRAKNIAIRMCYEKVELVIPYGHFKYGHFKKAQNFLHNKEFWIRKKLNSIQKPIFNNPDSLIIFDIYYTLKYIDSKDEKIQFCDDSIIIYTTIDDKTKILKQFLIDFLLLKITQIVRDVSNKQNLQFTAIKISNNKATWGSCSSKGRLFFNWRLVFVPVETLYYVIVHEICHLKEMNHSARFWNLVKNLCPDYKVHKIWLKENNYRITDYSKNLDLLVEKLT
jgi:predicted metal-dependent hydrolase